MCLAVKKPKNCMLFALIEEFGKQITIPVHYRKQGSFSPFELMGLLFYLQ